MFIISFRHCPNSNWKITAFSRRGLSLYSGSCTGRKGLPQAVRSPDQCRTFFLASSDSLSKCIRTRRQRLIGFHSSFCNSSSPRSIHLNGMRKLKRAKFCYPGKLEFLVSQESRSHGKGDYLPNLDTVFIPHLLVQQKSTGESLAHHFQRAILLNIQQ